MMVLDVSILKLNWNVSVNICVEKYALYHFRVRLMCRKSILDIGEELSSSSAALHYKDQVFVGVVFENKLLRGIFKVE